ncbi:chromosome segregation protein SMC [Desulfoluna sp.]|uniref:chromosome segregation protein SMC n=1 Tax=Desulfoluna sp. TaxID=2045199 RepID=UPI0026079FFF|nr:chromosome segregation protein SMC [Desulfoluna sp.]
MKLKKLEIAGFKSFMGKTRIVFPPGTTGVVGPNGCGKSNVVDALRWVMGEQNVRKLRGKTSEDIIFAGSTGNAPMNMAEVSLTIDNEDASIVGPFNEYSEITVTRRIYRSGESNYLINRQPARLKDIQTLFLGSGTGKNAFAVIQQGNIGALTDASPEERRVFIEEAADVTKYKARKRETESKIKSSRENLERVGDILSELQRQLASLKRQAKKALLFKELQGRIRNLDLTLSGVEYLTLSRKVAELTRSTERIKEQSKGAVTRREALASAMARLKIYTQETTDAIEAHNRKIFELKRLADRDENEVTHLKEKSMALTAEGAEDNRHLTEARARNHELTEEIRTLQLSHGKRSEAVAQLEQKIQTAESLRSTHQTRVTALEKKSLKESSLRMESVAKEASLRHAFSNAKKLQESATRKLKRRDEDLITAKAALTASTETGRLLEEEKENLKKETASLSDHLVTLRNGIQAQESEALRLDEVIKQKEIEESRIRSFFDTMQHMIQNLEGYGNGVKEGMTQLDHLGSTHHEVLADLIQVEKGYEGAVETALGALLTHIVVASREMALKGARAMQGEETGRCGFLALEPSRMSPFAEPPLTGCRPLTDLVTLDDRFNAPFPALLSRLFVADDLASALNARGETDQPVAIATHDGGLVDFSGAVVAGTQGASASPLKRRREMADAKEKLATLDADLLKRKGVRETLGLEIKTRKETLTAAESELRERLRLLSDKERVCLLANEEIKQKQKHLTLMDLETEQLEGDLTDLEDEISTTQEKLESVQGELAQLIQKAETARHELSETRQSLSAADQALVELKLSLAREEAKHENHRGSLVRLTGFLKEGEDRVQRLHDGIAKKEQDSKAGLAQAHKLEEGLLKAFAAITAEEEALAATRLRLARLEADMGEKDKELKELASHHDERSETLRKEEVELARVRTRGEELKTRTLEQYRAPIDELIPAFEEEIHAVLRGETTQEALKQKIDGLKRKIGRIGDVNPAAVTEYEEVNERHGFLHGQQTDLIASLDDLEAIIRKINQITQERFIDTFHRINEKLEEIFPKLFEGGSARLVLTDPKNPLETGVELMIQPPGKKQARLSLLSGGEKALSAIAFVFSIFLLKPSSFCVMDEIDAPLDDANVIRFNNLVTLIAEKSQILVITHNKITMEHADILIGVTMEKKGVSKVVSVNLSGKELAFSAPEIESA